MGAVHHLHGLGIAHRDTSFENLVVADVATMHVKLVNMGLASAAAQSRAPECSGAPGFGPYDPLKADIWACGALLFVMLFGAYYVYKPGRDDRLNSWWGQVPPGAGAVSPGCAALLDAMLRARPEARIGAADAVRDPWLRSGAPPEWPQGVPGPAEGAQTELEMDALIAAARAP